MILTFIVLGTPQPGGSKRAFRIKGSERITVTDANPRTKPWQHAVASAAGTIYQGPLLRGPLALTLRFYLPRPKGHFGKHSVRPTAPSYPCSRPDVTKLLRACEDAMQGVLYANDAQIVRQEVSKDYGEPARVEVVVEALEERGGDTCEFPDLPLP